MAYLRLMNGSNRQEGKDRRPMHRCPADFCRKNDLEVGWYERAVALLR
jgi:hypothetical protein